MKAPRNIPNTKTKFHTSFFQSYLKKGIFVGIHEAQMCLKDELIPKDLLPNIKSTGTVKPMSGPAAMCQGQEVLKILSYQCDLFLNATKVQHSELRNRTLVTQEEMLL